MSNADVYEDMGHNDPGAAFASYEEARSGIDEESLLRIHETAVVEGYGSYFRRMVVGTAVPTILLTSQAAPDVGLALPLVFGGATSGVLHGAWNYATNYRRRLTDVTAEILIDKRIPETTTLSGHADVRFLDQRLKINRFEKDLLKSRNAVACAFLTVALCMGAVSDQAKETLKALDGVIKGKTPPALQQDNDDWYEYPSIQPSTPEGVEQQEGPSDFYFNGAYDSNDFA